MSKTDLIYLKIWCDSVTFCQRGHLFYSPYMYLYVQCILSQPAANLFCKYRTSVHTGAVNFLSIYLPNEVGFKLAPNPPF